MCSDSPLAAGPLVSQIASSVPQNCIVVSGLSSNMFA